MAEQSYWAGLTGRSLSRRRLIAAGTAGAATAALAACGSQKPAASTGTQSGAAGQAGTPNKGGTLNALTALDYPLDPHKVSAGAQRLIGGVYSRVFKFQTTTNSAFIDDHIEEVDLGMSAESPDAITWTIKLRANAKFHNVPPVSGHAVEAEDVKATFQRILDPKTSSPNLGQLNMIDPNQIQTPDHQTVVFKLNYQYSPFKSLLGSPSYSWILPREAYAGTFDPTKTAIGSGPFILSNIQPSVAYTYTRNPDWHLGPDAPYVDSVKIAVIPDLSTQYAQFAVGNLDELPVANPFDVPTVKQQNPKATFVKTSSGLPLPLYFQMGTTTTPFKDVRLRQAISACIDRDALQKAVWNGQGSASVFVPTYMGKWAFPVDQLDADTKQFYSYNPSEVKKLLAAAGQPNFSVRFVNPWPPSNVTFAKTVEVVNQSFNSLGIKSTIVLGDYNKDFVDSGHGWRQGYFDDDMIMFASSASYTEADDWLYSYFHSKSTSNQERLVDPTYDAMVDKERTLVNDADRLKAVQDIEKYIAKQLYAPSTMGSYAYNAIQPRVQNYCYSSTLGAATETYAKLWLNS